MIEILDLTELPRARRAGALMADILAAMKARCQVGTNLLDIDRWTQEMIAEAGASLIDATERALAAGIAAAGPGAHVGDISHAIGGVLTDATRDGAEVLTVPSSATG